MELRLWAFVAMAIFCIWYGYFTDLRVSGIRVSCSLLVHDLLFLKKDGRKKLIAVIFYQTYMEILLLVYIIPCFWSDKWIYDRLLNEWLDLAMLGIYGLIIWAWLFSAFQKLIQKKDRKDEG